MILDLFKLDGRVALVTGATRGLGQGMALGLAEAGADIVGVSRSTDWSEVEPPGPDRSNHRTNGARRYPRQQCRNFASPSSGRVSSIRMASAFRGAFARLIRSVAAGCQAYAGARTRQDHQYRIRHDVRRWTEHSSLRRGKTWTCWPDQVAG